MKKMWLSCRVFTVQVDLDSRGYITQTAPIVAKFIGQHWKSLHNWVTSRIGKPTWKSLN